MPGHPPVEPDKQQIIDLLVDGRLHQRIKQPKGRSILKFIGWVSGVHRFELYFYQIAPVMLLSVRIDDDATATPWLDDRPYWVAYGSSITQCAHVSGPSETWPAIVASQWDLNHTNLSYGGNANLDSIVARMIADIPADAISLCFSVNNYGGPYSHRTWRAAVIGFILTIRDKHPNTPMLCTSPIWSPSRESIRGIPGLSLVSMRKEVEHAIDALKQMGDAHLHYTDGLSLFDDSQSQYLPDGLHPNAQGCRVLADRYTSLAMPWFAKQLGWSKQLEWSNLSSII